jgi:hypothetical protein
MLDAPTALNFLAALRAAQWRPILRQFTPRLFLAAIAVAVFPVLAFAQNTMSVDPEPEPPSRPRATMTADQVLAKHIEAIGGRTARAKLSSLVAKGTVEYDNIPLSGTIEVYAKAPDKILEVMTVPSVGSIMRGFDGVTGWTSNPREGSRVLTGAELASIKRSAAFNGDVEWQTLFKSVSVASVESFAGQDYYILEFVPFGSDETVQRRFYNADTFLLTRLEGTMGDVRGGESVAITISDYRRVSGVLMPFSSETRTSRFTMKITLKSATFNVPIALSKFKKR